MEPSKLHSFQDFFNNEIEYDSMKSLLQLNSFTDINNLEEIVNANVKIHLYHSEFIGWCQLQIPLS